MKLTLAICTYNRARLLAGALESLAKCERPYEKWQLLVVDNNSTDETASIVKSYRGRLPVEYHFEPMQGLSAARNRALAECRSDVVLFTDDDLRFDAGWLEDYARAFEAHPEAGWFGGRIRPLWDNGRPAWLKDDRLALLDGLLVHYDLGPTGRAYTTVDPSPFGASFALRRSIFERFGSFRLDLGVKGRDPGRGEEAEYFERVKGASVPGWYVGESSAWHWQDSARFSLRHLYKYGFEKGLAEVRLRRVEERAVGSAYQEAWFLLKALGQLARGRGDRARQCIINMGIHRGLRVGRT